MVLLGVGKPQAQLPVVIISYRLTIFNDAIFLEDPFQTSKVSVGEIPMVSASILAMKKPGCSRYIGQKMGGDPNPLLTGYTLFGGSSHWNS